MFSFILTETNAWIDYQDLRQVCSHIEFYYKYRHVHKIIFYTVYKKHPHYWSVCNITAID